MQPSDVPFDSCFAQVGVNGIRMQLTAQVVLLYREKANRFEHLFSLQRYRKGSASQRQINTTIAHECRCNHHASTHRAQLSVNLDLRYYASRRWGLIRRRVLCDVFVYIYIEVKTLFTFIIRRKKLFKIRPEINWNLLICWKTRLPQNIIKVPIKGVLVKTFFYDLVRAVNNNKTIILPNIY